MKVGTGMQGGLVAEIPAKVRKSLFTIFLELAL